MMYVRAFTLIELVIALVISSIIAILSVQFIQSSASASIDNSVRQQMSAHSTVINEKISRAVRSALPGSLRVTSDGQCLEYILIKASSVYTSLRTGRLITQFKAVPYSSTASISGHVAVYPLSVFNPYHKTNRSAVSSSVLTLPAGNSEVTVTVSPAHQFPYESPLNRFYMIDTPQAICQQGEFLYRYKNYGFIKNISDLKPALPDNISSGRELLANSLINNSMIFRYQQPDLKRNALVTFKYQLGNNKNSDILTTAQEVNLRNVP